jgi:hypothetical protein
MDNFERSAHAGIRANFVNSFSAKIKGTYQSFKKGLAIADYRRILD